MVNELGLPKWMDEWMASCRHLPSANSIRQTQFYLRPQYNSTLLPKHNNILLPRFGPALYLTAATPNSNITVIYGNISTSFPKLPPLYLPVIFPPHSRKFQPSAEALPLSSHHISTFPSPCNCNHYISTPLGYAIKNSNHWVIQLFFQYLSP